MSNPTATIGDTIPVPSDPKVSRKSYSAIVFNEQQFFKYAESGSAAYDPTYTTYDPSNLGQRSFVSVPLDYSLGGGIPVPAGNHPQFLTQTSWDGTVKLAPSSFVTGRYSVMPKIMVPSDILVDNGIQTPGLGLGAYSDPGTLIEAFNWIPLTLNAASISIADIVKYAQLGGIFGTSYVAVRAKDDSVALNEFEMKLVSPPVMAGGSAPTPGTQGWSTGHPLVVGGAFMLMLNVTPSLPAKASAGDVKDNKWELKIEFGDVIMIMNAVGALQVGYTAGADREEGYVTVNLADGKTKEGPPQQEHIVDKNPYIILVYPVWNGIIVMSGNQESREVIGTSSTFVPFKKGRSIMVPPYSSGFDPTSPADVEVGVGTGASNVIVNFGTEMLVTVTNLELEIAYLPTFFSGQCWFDEFFVASDDQSGVVDFSYNVYPIWTKNGLTVTLGSTTPIQSSFAGPVSNTSYWYVMWRMAMARHDRYAGELFGSFLEITEARDFPIKNNNGNFAINWTGGTPGDPSPSGDWKDYVQAISVNVGLDGSDGSISVDKYGVAGQDADAVQSIGAVTISMTGGYGTVAGSIFQGLGMGISETKSVEGASWEIPLIGLEKKMEDIALINVPFMDGETVYTAVDFLARYCGIIADFSNAPYAAVTRLSVSEDVNVARFDWKSGTSVASALNDVGEDVNYGFVVRDGKIFVYELDAYGLPVYPGPDRAPLYPDTKLILEDMTPDFEDLRNEIVLIGLEMVPQGTGTSISDIPLFPRIDRRSTVTTPDVPWARSLVKAIPGTVNQTTLGNIATNIARKSSKYAKTGRTSIPGNADIKPWDKWGSLYIERVTHTIDFNAKTWTTELAFSLPAS